MAAILRRRDLILSTSLMLLTLYIPSVTTVKCNRSSLCHPLGIKDKAEAEKLKNSTRFEAGEVTCDVCIHFVCFVDDKKNVMEGLDCSGNVGKICTDVDAATLSSLKSDTKPMTYSVGHTHLLLGCNTEECMTSMKEDSFEDFLKKLGKNNMEDFGAKIEVFHKNFDLVKNSTCEGHKRPVKVRLVPISKYSRKNSGIQVNGFKVLGIIMLGWMMMALL